jgi:hypothetical protein
MFGHMSRPWRPLRLIRALLACLALCVAAVPALADTVWTEATVLVSGAAPPGRVVRRVTRAVRQVQRLAAHSAVPVPPTEHFLESIDPLALVLDVYLRNCVLLR